MQDEVDLLQIKIDKAKSQLSDDTLSAINAVPWQAGILALRETKGYTFEQLGNLEIETELVLCGLLRPEDYPKELENRMRINKAQANELVAEMNEMVFKKIKEELIKITEKRDALKKSVKKDDDILKSAGIKIITPEAPKVNPSTPQATPIGGAPAPKPTPVVTETHPILAQKLSGPVQTPSVKTEHTLDNLTKAPSVPATLATSTTPPPPATYQKGADPYRVPPI